MWLALSFGFFVAAVLAHAVLCRLPLRVDFVLKSLLVGMPVGLALVAVTVRRFGLGIEAAAAALLYAFLFELYIFCFTLVSTSVSVSILLKLAERELTSDEIEGQYSDKSMVEGRFTKLVRSGFLTQCADGYRATSKARLILAGFRTIRYFFRHPEAAR